LTRREFAGCGTSCAGWPQRAARCSSQVLTAKIAAGALAGIAFGVLGEAIGWAIGYAILGGRGITVVLSSRDILLLTLGGKAPYILLAV
jgi:hypothetical protein